MWVLIILQFWTEITFESSQIVLQTLLNRTEVDNVFKFKTFRVCTTAQLSEKVVRYRIYSYLCAGFYIEISSFKLSYHNSRKLGPVFEFEAHFCRNSVAVSPHKYQLLTIKIWSSIKYDSLKNILKKSGNHYWFSVIRKRTDAR